MSRQTERALGRKIKALSDREAYIAIENAIQTHSQVVYEDLITALMQEFGFGDKRLERLAEAFNRVHSERE